MSDHTHELKTYPEYFEEVWAGRKLAEVRDCKGRNFHVGDTVLLREWNVDSQVYTGRVLSVSITHILTGLGLQEGWAMLSIKVWGRKRECLHCGHVSFDDHDRNYDPSFP